MNITDRQAEYVREVTKTLRDKGFRAESDLRNEKIGYKIRAHTLHRVPYLLVIGDREVEQGQVAVRDRQGQDHGVMPVESFIESLSTAVAARN
jgi:threonyl-tRNA synthetase